MKMNEKVKVVEGTYTREELFVMASGWTLDVTVPAPVASAVPAEPIERSIFFSASRLWGSLEPPTGRPSACLMLDTLAWIRGNDTHMKSAIDSLHGSGKAPRIKKSLSDFADVVVKMPVSDSTRWLTVIMADDGTVKPEAVHLALAEINPMKMIDQLEKVGVLRDELDPSGEAWRRSRSNEKIRDIVDGKLNDRHHMPVAAALDVDAMKISGSVSAVVVCLKKCFDAIPDAQRTQMSQHILLNFDADMDKAFRPLAKLLHKNGDGEVMPLLRSLIEDGRVHVSTIAMVFTGSWEPLYNGLRSCLRTTGPKLPWIG